MLPPPPYNERACQGEELHAYGRPAAPQSSDLTNVGGIVGAQPNPNASPVLLSWTPPTQVLLSWTPPTQVISTCSVREYYVDNGGTKACSSEWRAPRPSSPTFMSYRS
ncbi:uncharacterized protein [Aegilops tauschii subsp. strangulata]|uniref:uncharacterized protein n=1 Tax=Aegilops tauschii subsp. strangulata TaxID=200361 RepID=UPI00098B67C9|nr:uncharacterized protein LOC109747885 [Aegilops tauschii subsp. strangulata]